MKCRSLILLMLGSSLCACGPSSSREINQCNDPSVLDTLKAGTIDAWIDWAAKYKEYKIRLNKEYDKLAPAKDEDYNFNGWDMEVENIRQTEYDKKNNTRYCVSSVRYTGTPQSVKAIISDSRALITFGFPGAASLEKMPILCNRQVSYKLTPILDKPANFYINWQCD